MEYRFFWADGQVDYTPANSGLTYSDLLMRMKDRGIISPDTMTQNYAAGLFNTEQGVKVEQQGGESPDQKELAFIMTQQLERYDPRPRPQLPRITAATVEDTEPAYNFGFLTEPHSTLYPCAFEGEKMRPDAIKLIKSWILPGVLEGEPEWEDYIAFTVYGSGASYNWDEEGDFDVQMWVDVDKYNAKAAEPLTVDELVDNVRRHVQTLNFPSFQQVGLATEECSGSMLIQYYPKPGKGTEEENLASKPYACYDMDADKWLQKPEPITPEFYGQMFLMVHSKAEDIASQAEDLIAQLDRNILNWQFWTQMAEKYDSPAYDEIADKSQANAKLEQQGIQTLFEGVFGGRREAYSPEGRGYKDERDIVQKMLEVWGTFQKLKHYARMPLPWDEVEMPEAPVEAKVAAATREDVWNSQTFAYIDGNLILSQNHHQGILGDLIKAGWTWEQLMMAPQAWGWHFCIGNDVYLRFTSDAGLMTDIEGAKQAFRDLGYQVKMQAGFENPRGIEEKGKEYGQGLGGRGVVDQYVKGLRHNPRVTEVPPPPKTAQVEFFGHPSFIYYAPTDTVYYGDDHQQIVNQNGELTWMDEDDYYAGWIGRDGDQWIFSPVSSDLQSTGNNTLAAKAFEALKQKYPNMRSLNDVWDEAVAWNE